jgi:polyhydroxyalkanoate synthesis regulator phasin
MNKMAVDMNHELLQRMTAVETKLDLILKEGSKSATKESVDALEKRVKDIEGNLTWLWRAVGTVLIAGIIGYFIK